MKFLKVCFLIIFNVILYSCGKTDGFAPTKILTNNLVISPSAITLAVNNTVALTATGGNGSNSYSIFSGEGSVLSTTGNYTAPAMPGTTVVRVVDGQGLYADAIITINGALQSSPINPHINLNATQVFTTTGGVPPIIFSLVSGLGTVSASGIYTASGTAGTAVIRATDSYGNISDSTVNVNSTNSAPVISSINAQSTNEDTPLVVNFTITDIDSSLNCNTSMSASTSNSAIINTGNIVFSGTAPDCSATITPTANQNGVVNLTFRVSDSEPLFMDLTFAVTINAVNDVPTIGSIGAQSVKSDSSIMVNYVINDVDNVLDCSTSVAVTSDTVGVLPNTDITKGGTAPNCTLSITPSLNAAGTSNITVTVSDGVFSANSSLSLEVINVTSVTVSPSTLNVAIGGVAQLSASANYSDASSNTITATSGTSWSSSNSAVVAVNNTTSKGLITGVSNGSANVSITYKGLTSNNSVISVLTVTSVTVSIGAVSGGVGSQNFVSATAQNGTSSFDITTTGVWTTSDSAVATVSNGLISYLSSGSAVVTVTYAGLSANVNVTVLNKSLVSIAITTSGGGSSLQINGTINMVATATYSDASTEVVTSSAVWSSSNDSVLTTSNTLPYVGRATGIAGGTSTVIATLGAISGSLLMTVNVVTLLSIAITPDDPLVTSGASYSLRATGTYSDASTADITDLVTWTSSNTLAATISNVAGAQGVASTPVFTGYRTTNITATLSAVSGVTPFGVNGATVSSLAVTPTVTLTANQTYQLKAYVNLSDGGVIDVTEFAIWSSGTVGNVSVSNSVGSKGLVTGVANGTSTITAVFNSVSGTRLVTVAGASSAIEIGVGLLGSYYNWTGGAPPSSPFLPGNKKGQRIDSKVNFAWASGSAPMGVSDKFSVRWTGFYKATDATNYFCTYSDDGVRVWINGVLVINNWTEHGGTWNCSGNIALTVGTKYAVIIEYYENGGGSEAHFTRSSISAANAQNTTTKAVPQIDLYPE